MAISDTLSDAVAEMRRYLKANPSMYADYQLQLSTLIYDMEAMRIVLDAPPAKACSKGTIGCNHTTGPHLNCWVGD